MSAFFEIKLTKMKYLLIAVLMAIVSSCQSQKNPHIATIYGLDTRIAVPERDRSIGYDSIQLVVHDGKIEANFCYPNGLRFKKDTIFTDDMKYKLWGFQVQIAPDVFIVTSKDKPSMTMRNGRFNNGYCDSVDIDNVTIKVNKVK